MPHGGPHPENSGSTKDRGGGGGAELLCCPSHVEPARLSCGEATSSQIVLSLRKSRKKPGMWPHLGKEAKERKNEPMQQSQARPPGAQSQHPAHTCTHAAGRPASSTLPPPSPPQSCLDPCPRPRYLPTCTQAHRGPTRHPAIHSAQTCVCGELLTQDPRHFPRSELTPHENLRKLLANEALPASALL